MALREPMSDGVVTIRPPVPDDTARIVGGRDDQFHRFLGEGAPDPRPVACVVVDGELVGWVDYDHDDDRTWLRPGEVNVGYALFAPFRGHGYATRAVRLLMRHVATDTEHTVGTLWIRRDNERSLALARRAGFERVDDLEGNPYWKQRADAFVRPVNRMHEHEVDIDEALVRGLVATQFAEYASLPLTRVVPWGTDNAIWRLGDELVVRLPRIEWSAGQVSHEATWLPRLAPHLTVAVPEPVAVGEPDLGYPFPWAIHRWLPGAGATLEGMDDPAAFAADLARLVEHLQRVPTDGAPAARNRARPLRDYDDETRAVIDRAAHVIDAGAALAVWEDALAAPEHEGRPVWVHGDLEGNCLLRDGRLSGIVDWSLACAGDPAIDVQVVWSPLFDTESRRVYLDALGVDDATIARSRGAAVNQACAALPYYLDTYPLIVERAWHKLALLGVNAI